MQHTTVGQGPFKPAVHFDDLVYVLDTEFDSEDDAAQAAFIAVEKIIQAGKDVLQHMGYVEGK